MICYFMVNTQVKIKTSSESVGLVVLIFFSIGESNGSKSNINSEDFAFLHTFPYGGTGNKLNDPTLLVLDQSYLEVTANVK